MLHFSTSHPLPPPLKQPDIWLWLSQIWKSSNPFFSFSSRFSSLFPSDSTDTHLPPSGKPCLLSQSCMVDRRDRSIFFSPLPVFKTVTIYYLQEGCVSFSGFSSFGALPSQQHMRLALSWEHSLKGTWEEQNSSRSSHWQLGHPFMSNKNENPHISSIQPATAT